MPAPKKPAKNAPGRNQSNRRKFIKKSSLIVAGGAVASQLAVARSAHAAFHSDEIKIGLVGCGGRGTGAANQAMNTDGKTRLVAVADAFDDRMQQCIRGLQRQHKDLSLIHI